MCMLCLILSLDFKVLISKLNVCALFTMAIYVMLVEQHCMRARYDKQSRHLRCWTQSAITSIDVKMRSDSLKII